MKKIHIALAIATLSIIGCTPNPYMDKAYRVTNYQKNLTSGNIYCDSIDMITLNEVKCFCDNRSFTILGEHLVVSQNQY